MSKSYRVKYSLWRIDANSPEEAKKEICHILRTMPEKFLSVEESIEKRPLWRLLLTGK